MAVTIRFSRFGRKKAPTFRVVVADNRSKRDGRVIEFLGHVNPKNDKDISVDQERVAYWIERGALPSTSVAQLLKRLGKES